MGKDVAGEEQGHLRGLASREKITSLRHSGKAEKHYQRNN
jgi:hypothetical protein